MNVVAALFVQRDGVYYGLPDVDPWDKARDARFYHGPYPVVAHPPCDRWGRYWGGGPSAKVKRKLGDDDGCFESALRSVRKFGGVLEHPEGSHAFRYFGIRLPKWREGWVEAKDGWVCCVSQGHYGHRARKLTWLYAVGVDRPQLDFSIPALKSRLDYGFHSARERRERRDHIAPLVNATRLSSKENNATPVPFRDVLLDMARSTKR